MKTIEQARIDKGISIKAIAKHLGVSRHTYRSYEKNQDAMSIGKARAACEFIGVPIDEIFLPKEVK